MAQHVTKKNQKHGDAIFTPRYGLSAEAGPLRPPRGPGIQIECIAEDMPKFIKIDLSNLNIEENIYISDIKLEKSISIIDLKKGMNKIVVNIKQIDGYAKKYKDVPKIETLIPA